MKKILVGIVVGIMLVWFLPSAALADGPPKGWSPPGGGGKGGGGGGPPLSILPDGTPRFGPGGPGGGGSGGVPGYVDPYAWTRVSLTNPHGLAPFDPHGLGNNPFTAGQGGGGQGIGGQGRGGKGGGGQGRGGKGGSGKGGSGKGGGGKGGGGKGGR